MKKHHGHLRSSNNYFQTLTFWSLLYQECQDSLKYPTSGLDWPSECSGLFPVGRSVHELKQKQINKQKQNG